MDRGVSGTRHHTRHAGASAPTFRWNGAKLPPWQVLATGRSSATLGAPRHDEAPPPSQGRGLVEECGGRSGQQGQTKRYSRAYASVVRWMRCSCQAGCRPSPLGAGEVHGAAHHGHRLPGPAAG